MPINTNPINAPIWNMIQMNAQTVLYAKWVGRSLGQLIIKKGMQARGWISEKAERERGNEEKRKRERRKENDAPCAEISGNMILNWVQSESFAFRKNLSSAMSPIICAWSVEYQVSKSGNYESEIANLVWRWGIGSLRVEEEERKLTYYVEHTVIMVG